MSNDMVTVSVSDGVATLSLARPPVNSYDKEFLEELRESLYKVRYNDDAKVVIVSSELDEFFSAGADIKFMSNKDAEFVNMFSIGFHEMTEIIENTPKIFIAAINGKALGGGLELTLACDLRFAVPDAELGLVEVKAGLLPAAGGTQRLPEIINDRSRAMDMMITGETVSGEEAAEIGMVDRLYDADELMDEAESYAEKIASGATKSIGTLKQVINNGNEIPRHYGMAMERQGLDRVFVTDDAEEGMEAFKEGRRPDFEGK